ncbi:hypothetical protein [Stenotrophomonas sp. TWI602]|uniref:hypothetical protein n=1 Tax=Stenotrophomonas sp. TWI602 TaxID=3136786 RepID=UPI0032080941
MKIGFSGHQDLPTEAAILLKQRLQTLFYDAKAIVGVCALAEGGDHLFARAVLERSGELEVVVPCQGYETTFDEESRLEYERLLRQATKMTTLDFSSPSEAAYMAAGKYIVEHCDVLVAAWDGRSARGLGGTADVVKYAEHVGVRVIVIWPEGVER